MKTIKPYVTIYDTNYKAIFTSKMENKIKLRWIHMMCILENALLYIPKDHSSEV
jgi:hypothetical protein